MLLTLSVLCRELLDTTSSKHSFTFQPFLAIALWYGNSTSYFCKPFSSGISYVCRDCRATPNMNDPFLCLFLVPPCTSVSAMTHLCLAPHADSSIVSTTANQGRGKSHTNVVSWVCVCKFFYALNVFVNMLQWVVYKYMNVPKLQQR